MLYLLYVQVLLYSHAPFTNCSQRQNVTGEVYCSVPDPKNPYVFLLIRIQIRIRISLYGDPNSDPSIDKQKNKENLDFYSFVTSQELVIFED
jgi:hypothetical protein